MCDLCRHQRQIKLMLTALILACIRDKNIVLVRSMSQDIKHSRRTLISLYLTSPGRSEEGKQAALSSLISHRLIVKILSTKSLSPLSFNVRAPLSLDGVALKKIKQSTLLIHKFTVKVCEEEPVLIRFSSGPMQAQFWSTAGLLVLCKFFVSLGRKAL